MTEITKELSTYIHLSKYSRWIERECRRETWDETVDRLCDFWESKRLGWNDSMLNDFIKVREAIRNLEVMPSMRSLMTAGKALDRDNVAGFNCAAIAVNHPRVFDEIFYLLMNGCGVGFSVERQYTNQLPVVAEKFYETSTTIKIGDSKIGWAKGLKELIAFLYNGDIPNWDLSAVRPAGTRLKTFGGRASGPGPLDELFRYTVRQFTRAAGRKLNSIECHDLVCKIADTVIAGSVRRSACISLSNLTDDRMARAKRGSWWETDPQRALANNSVAYTEKPDLESYLKEWRNLYESKAGERGMINKNALREKAESCGREYDRDYLLNPCVTGDTLLLTNSGYYPIRELVSKEVLAWNGEQMSKVVPFSTGINEILEVCLSNGATLKCTPYHKFILKGGVRSEAQDLIVGDKLEKFTMPVVDSRGSFPWELGYSQGFYSGDGSSGGTSSHLYFTKFSCESRLRGTFSSGSSYRKEWNHGHLLCKTFVPINESISFKLNWLAGLLDSDGHIQRNPNSFSLVISSTDYKFLNDCRIMLTTLGVQSVVCKMKDEEVRSLPGGVYTCKESYRLLIGSTDTKSLIDLGLSCERLDLSMDCSPNRDASRFVTVVSVTKLGYKEETFCATEELNHSLTFNGIVTGQCGEAILRDSGGLCNLTEVIVRPNDTLETLKSKVRYATILGTLQSTLSDFRYLRKIWRDNQEEERLLGVSLTGIMDHPILSGAFWGDGSKQDLSWNNELGFYNSTPLPQMLEELKQVAYETNREWVEYLNINPSKQLTLVKPSGTVSTLCGTSSGIHPRYSPFYLRRVTQDNKDPLTDLMKSEGIPYCIRGEKTIFSFPIKSPENAICARDMGAIQQLELWKIYRDYWCDGNPSQTIYYTDDEFLDVQSWVWKNWDSIGGLSFFPLDDYIYDKEAQPYLEITEEEYVNEMGRFPEAINWERLGEFEVEDRTQIEVELACSGGKCEL